jgi:hypothetical protein
MRDLRACVCHRFTCNQYAPGNCLPIVRTMFHGHTLVECQADEAQIMRLMSETRDNRERMREFLLQVERECVPAALDCVPENASAATQHSTVQATGLLTVDSQHWTPELPERIGLYHAYIRGFNRDVRTHRLFIICSGGMNRASDMFCNLVIDVGRKCTAQVGWRGGCAIIYSYLTNSCSRAGHMLLTRGVVAQEGVPTIAPDADQETGKRVRHFHAVGAGEAVIHLIFRSMESFPANTCKIKASRLNCGGLGGLGGLGQACARRAACI